MGNTSVNVHASSIEVEVQRSQQGSWLSVSRNRTGARYIVNEAGEAVHIFGMARCAYHSDDDEDPVYGGVEGLVRHFQALGVNMIRLSIHESKNKQPADLIESCGGYNPEGIQRYIDRYVDPDVQAIISAGLYVIVDLHMYPPTSEHPSGIVKYARDHYFPIWAELAKRYKDEPMVAMYELWNEPYAADQGVLKLSEEGKIMGEPGHGYDWNSDVREFYVDLVRLIREIDQQHIVMISDYNAGWGTGWGTTWEGHLDRLDPRCNNLVFSQHAAYVQLDDGPCSEMAAYWTELADQANIALFFGEVETEDDLMNEQAMANFIAFLQNSADTHHFPAILWRPHNDEKNYVHVWTDFAHQYTKKANKP